MSWIEHEHPRDEVGRFRERHSLDGSTGAFDLLAMRASRGVHLGHIEAYRRNQQQQGMYVKLRDQGRLTAEQDKDWDRLGDEATDLAQNRLPKAFHKGLRPGSDGAWYAQDRSGKLSGLPHDEHGAKIPAPAMQGAIRVADVEDGGMSMLDGGGFVHESSGGLWHVPGERSGGELVVRNDFGIRVGGYERTSLPREHRGRRGTFARAETRAELAGRREAEARGRTAPVPERASADVQGSFMASALNPVSRRRSAGVKRRRRDAVAITGTWIDRLEARMRAQGEAGR